MTVRVLDIYPETGDVRVERLTGKGRILKRPSSPALIVGKDFAARMHPTERTGPWGEAIHARYGNG